MRATDRHAPLSPWIVPSVRGLLGSYSWHDKAACRDADPGLFVSDVSLGQDRHLASPKVLLAFLACSACPVRSECLAESLRSHRVQLDADTFTEAVTAGVWGGSTQWDRRAVRGLPPDESAQELERTFPERLARRVAAFQAAHSNGHAPTPLVRQVRRVLVRIAVAGVERRNGNDRLHLPARQS